VLPWGREFENSLARRRKRAQERTPRAMARVRAPLLKQVQVPTAAVTAKTAAVAAAVTVADIAAAIATGSRGIAAGPTAQEEGEEEERGKESRKK
jgi:hypothetical protein